ncbi:Hsp20/alpha crystallin family protein [Telluria beijingensis]|uniref:Hsp20/alpha crystallin family protein n=1 Tax=Telluria beijingensis TaxID=3068633 RepID=UPI00279623D6|nr:Hsp20/alpha crystallin family protein [Massilia sp. REN29]
MNRLTRFDPFNEITRFEPFRNMDEFFNDLRMVPGWRGPEAQPRIRVDVAETEQAYTLKAEIPGVNKDDIKVAVEGNQVTLTAEVRQEKDEKTENTLRSERYFGVQTRSFTLPQDVDDANAQAMYKDGILELTLPKKPGTARRQLQIQ